jgi:Uma2 family endonuclease
MSTTTPLTAEQLLAMPNDGMRSELVAGELRMMSPSGWTHGDVVGRLSAILGHHVVVHELGKVFGAETGFLIQRDPDTVRAPDIAFIAHANLPATKPAEGFWPGAPDLAVEVLSPSDRRSDVDQKTAAWLAAGCAQVWEVDPQTRSIAIHQSGNAALRIEQSGRLDGGDLLPGFSCSLAEIFGEPSGE